MNLVSKNNITKDNVTLININGIFARNMYIIYLNFELKNITNFNGLTVFEHIYIELQKVKYHNFLSFFLISNLIFLSLMTNVYTFGK